MPVSARRYASAWPLDGPPTSGVPVAGAKAGSTKSISNERYAAPPADPRPHAVAVLLRREPLQLVPGDRVVAQLAGRLHVARRSTACPACRPAPRRADRPALPPPRVENRAVEVAGAVIRLPHVSVRVQVDERQRAVHGRGRAQLAQHHRVVAAQAERRHTGRVHRAQEAPRSAPASARGSRAPWERRRSRPSRAARPRPPRRCGLYGRSSADALRIPSGPKRAPDLNETASSVGMPTTATSTSSGVCTYGRRMNVRGPEKRGMREGSAGP